jgi:diguanylate cyclase (GGDEF)-like protein
VQKIILAAGSIVFNVLDIFLFNDSMRSIVSPYIILAIYSVPTISFIVKKDNSRFKHSIGGFYVLFLFSIFPRIIMPMTETGLSPYENAIAETGFYLVLIIITVCGTLSTLLFIKERSDILLEKMALNDQLTQIANRYSFLNNAENLFLKCRREKRELALMYMDIDYFKKINDTYGHNFGDVVLKRFATVIKESVRPYDLICRYGGEEFLIMLQCEQGDQAEKIGIRLMERLKEEHFDEYPDFRFTVSIGINASVPNDEDTLDRYINNADTALYNAKESGRNTIRLYQNCA